MSMRLQTLSVFALATLVGFACGPRKEPDAPGPRPIVVPDTQDCKVLCDHLAKLGCEEGHPVYNSDLPGPYGVPNQSCAEWCTEIQDRGTFLNPKCVKKVQSCVQIEEWRKKTCTD
jgi:hypothetical protein